MLTLTAASEARQSSMPTLRRVRRPAKTLRSVRPEYCLSLSDDDYDPLDAYPNSAGKERWKFFSTNRGALSHQKPVLMIFEDAHWADPTSLEVFGRMLTRSDASVLLIVRHSRPEFEPAVDWCRIA